MDMGDMDKLEQDPGNIGEVSVSIRKQYIKASVDLNGQLQLPE